MIIGETTIYGKIIRVGGISPKIMIETLQGDTIFCDVSERIAKQLAQKLYCIISLNGTATWSPGDLKLKKFKIKDIGLYEQKSVASAMKELSEKIGKHFNNISDIDDFALKLRNGDLK